MDPGLAILLASLGSVASNAIFGSGQKQSTPFKGWVSPSLGLQDPYLLNAMYKRGLQYGIGDSNMFSQIQSLLGDEWPEIMRSYTGTGKKGQVGIGNLRG